MSTNSRMVDFLATCRTLAVEVKHPAAIISHTVLPVGATVYIINNCGRRDRLIGTAARLLGNEMTDASWCTIEWPDGEIESLASDRFVASIAERDQWIALRHR